MGKKKDRRLVEHGSQRALAGMTEKRREGYLKAMRQRKEKLPPGQAAVLMTRGTHVPGAEIQGGMAAARAKMQAASRVKPFPKAPKRRVTK